MTTLETLGRKLETLGDLRDVVRTMKALSSSNLRQVELAANALADYYRGVELGLHVALRAGHAATPDPHPRTGGQSRSVVAILFGTDYGMCSRLNQTLCEYAIERLADAGISVAERQFLVVGAKAAAHLQSASQPMHTCLATPGSAEGIGDLVAQLLTIIDRLRDAGAAERVWLFFNQHLPAGPDRSAAGARRRVSATPDDQDDPLTEPRTGTRPFLVHLLPLDEHHLRRARELRWPGRGLPTHSLPASTLLASLVRQYLFVSLSRACAESQASEHQARLLATQAAERNIAREIERSGVEFRMLRQEAITSEILDVVSGYEASRGANADLPA
jgi:F-type H+-transporting ATPase subunit gamma